MKNRKNKTDDVKSTGIIQNTPAWMPQLDMVTSTVVCTLPVIHQSECRSCAKTCRSASSVQQMNMDVSHLASKLVGVVTNMVNCPSGHNSYGKCPLLYRQHDTITCLGGTARKNRRKSRRAALCTQARRPHSTGRLTWVRHTIHTRQRTARYT